jgi:hypothetical protein
MHITGLNTIKFKDNLVISVRHIAWVQMKKAHEYNYEDKMIKCPAALAIQVGYVCHTVEFDTDAEAEKYFKVLRSSMDDME